ncbi:MAG TPA: copper amine oxidase, partial [Syntrophomonas sp.]|nr:copper amine oxidase [Syntrophomonas sp.]
YIRIGEEYGIRGDIAFFQAVKETNYFQFTGQVTPEQNNYCGLWATGSPLTGQESYNGADPQYVMFEPGLHGASFVSPAAGVEAHIQHLYAYATKSPLPAGKVIIDPRFSLVSRGIAPNWQQLNARWAVPGTTYGQSILFDYWSCALNR